jgi:hypothetical protein
MSTAQIWSEISSPFLDAEFFLLNFFSIFVGGSTSWDAMGSEFLRCRPASCDLRGVLSVRHISSSLFLPFSLSLSFLSLSLFSLSLSHTLFLSSRRKGVCIVITFDLNTDRAGLGGHWDCRKMFNETIYGSYRFAANPSDNYCYWRCVTPHSPYSPSITKEFD